MDVFIYRAESYSGNLRCSDEAEPYWIDIGEILYEDMWPTDRYWLPLVLDRKSFTVYTLYSENAVLDCKIKDEIL